ncbi:MAG: hypothetical protein AB9842_07335 [Bacteroidales bacterium]
MKKYVWVYFLLISYGAGSQTGNSPMTHVLKNSKLEIHIDLPLSNYHFSRFDWTGKITHVRYKDILISGVENIGNKDDNKSGKGFYNEFGIHRAIGYDSIPEGEWFHKIGIGLLKKEGGDYSFSRSYEIQPALFTVQKMPDKIIIRCESKLVDGYSYTLEKEIALSDSGFRIKYLLKNTGIKTISTDEYNHNFIAIDKDPIGDDYILKFPFHLKAELPEGMVNPEGKVKIGLKDITFTGTPRKQFYFGNLSGSEDVAAGWELVNTKSKIGIRETGSFITNKVKLWGWEHVISPELFFEIHVKPGEEIEWSRTYTIFEIE